MMYGNLEFEHVITNIEKDENGEIMGYKLEDGRSISKYEAIELSREGAIAGISLEILEKREEFLESLPKEEVNMNLWNLQVIDEG
ncbi:DUF3892 domain-containing protein [Clostridium ganghwense]|uniref:DUF3892 domain-containing protein n=1 Tax=Clostridium ganghwense TaxID=312089 RepID=A0ABT4CKS0_9CLOT|nr:DUF3892 domain-containing protein [Clostridium ganghwense]MCY6369639.1 DUF3892 domain-containing protein [Clostridium ganghwense]